MAAPYCRKLLLRRSVAPQWASSAPLTSPAGQLSHRTACERHICGRNRRQQRCTPIDAHKFDFVGPIVNMHDRAFGTRRQTEIRPVAPQGDDVQQADHDLFSRSRPAYFPAAVRAAIRSGTAVL